MKKWTIFFIVLILLSIDLVIGVVFDNTCETWLGISGVISGWIAMAMCGYVLLWCILGGDNED